MIIKFFQKKPLKIENPTPHIPLYYSHRYQLSRKLKEVSCRKNIDTLKYSATLTKIVNSTMVHGEQEYTAIPPKAKDTKLLATELKMGRARIYNDGFSLKESPLMLSPLPRFAHLDVAMILYSVEILSNI